MNFRFGIVLPLSLIGASIFANSELEKRMLAHVEKITIVDSIAVDRNSFLQSYRLQPSAGSLLSSNEVAAMLEGVDLPDDFEEEPYHGFTNEFNDYLIWAQPDSTGYLRLAESIRLSDGNWGLPYFTSEVLNFGKTVETSIPIDANAAFPFMSDDGQTLYFAADNDQSLGGFDIFVATKDPSDGSFLIPRNIGMPFNSPFDDYMMVLDPLTGTGWWATDRNQLEDSLTIYVFAISDERINVDPSDESLLRYATLEGWEELMDETQLEKADSLRNRISTIKVSDRRPHEFELPMPGGITYTFYSDFKNRKAAEQMKVYLEEKTKVENTRKELASMRESYFKSTDDKPSTAKITRLENQLRKEEESLAKTLSEIYRLEVKK